MVPEEWTGRLRQFGIQLRNIITDIFVRIRQNSDSVVKVNHAIAIVEDGATATQAIASKRFVIWRGELYQAASAISVGDTFNAGTGGNLTALTQGAVNALGAAAWNDVANNLTRTSSGAVLDARQGKVLNDKITPLQENALLKTAQTLEAAEKAQVMTNLGLGDAATQTVANNVTTESAGSVLDARQGKALQDGIDAVEGKIERKSIATGTTQAEVLAAIDALIPASGNRQGYVTTAYAGRLGLPTQLAHHLIIMANSVNYRVIQAIPVDGSGVWYLAKQSGTWDTVWTSLNDTTDALDTAIGVVDAKVDLLTSKISSITNNNSTRRYAGIKVPTSYHGIVMFAHPNSGTSAAGLFIISQSATAGATCRVTTVYAGEKITYTTGAQYVIFYNDTTVSAYGYMINLNSRGPEKIVYGVTQADVEALLTA